MNVEQYPKTPSATGDAGLGIPRGDRPNQNPRAAPPSVSLPKGGAAIRGIGEKFSANSVTGTGSMSVPITVSPGRSGFGPQLTLSYDSGAGNGPFGFGWNLSLPQISRKTDKGLPRYLDKDESDVFLLSGAEDLVPVLDSAGNRVKTPRSVGGINYTIQRYRPRIEGLFARIERWSEVASGISHWRSITRDNVTTVYGRTAQSRIADPTTPIRVFTWLISESFDDKGNAIAYEYVAENSDSIDVKPVNERNRTLSGRGTYRYLKRIHYGNRQPNRDVATWHASDPAGITDPNAWMFEVVFDYGEGHVAALAPDAQGRPEVEAACIAPSTPSWPVRPDPFSHYRGGFEVRSYRRCQRVLMFHRFSELGTEPCLVRATEFAYSDFDYTQSFDANAESLHPGSTRFASFVTGIVQAGYVRDANAASVSRGGATFQRYLRQAYPPLEFEYSRAGLDPTVRDIDSSSLENLPEGVGGAFQWVDLNGEGLSGILTEQSAGWFYKENLSANHQLSENGLDVTRPRFGPLRSVATRPAPGLAGSRTEFMDLAGDGMTDLVLLDAPTPGFYERTEEGDWDEFRAFRSRPLINWNEPNLRFVDLDGDGHADILITEDDVFTWYPALAEDGFGAPCQQRLSEDEEGEPRVVFADGTQTIFLADFSGDGLTDLARIRNGEVCYWPNLGFARFGAKVTMDNSPWFDAPDQYDPQRIRLADIDGSGTTDIVYLGRREVTFWRNRSGNSWSLPQTLGVAPAVNGGAVVSVVDLLGTGTACLVWSSPLPHDIQRPMRYIDLMGGQKPHLLVTVKNNLGAETRVHYAPSTKFYLDDRGAGRPWVTRIPFPVQVVERVETYDRISRNRFVCRYAYHHGFFDGVEREFRGFGCIETWDTEEIGTVQADVTEDDSVNWESASFAPPVHTKTWYHVGAFFERVRIEERFRQRDYFNGDSQATFLEDTPLPAGLTAEETREACRAFKGVMLRQEVYADDRSARAGLPYLVTEQNFTVRLVQAMGGNRHAIFSTQQSETLTYHYDRNPNDPRIQHSMTLDVDAFGNVLKTAAITYGRRAEDATLPTQDDRDAQTKRWIVYSENDVTNPIDFADDPLHDDAYRAPLTCETRVYELTGYKPAIVGGLFSIDDFVKTVAGALVCKFDREISYELIPDLTEKQRRLFKSTRTLFRSDDLSAPLGRKVIESLALPFEIYRLALTGGLAANVFGTRISDPLFINEGGYTHLDGTADWWAPTGKVFYSPNISDTATQELTQARQHFFLPRRYRDPFYTAAVSTDTEVRYDPYDLLVEETCDPLGNRATAGTRATDPTQPLVSRSSDYRVLQAALVMDPNRNCTAAAYDALGWPVGLAVMGKPEDTVRQGDLIDASFEPDLSDAVIAAHLADPLGQNSAVDPNAILQKATTRFVYDIFGYSRSVAASTIPVPAVVYMLTRETHDADLKSGTSKIQHSFSYSDGFGREMQKKIQAEPGPAPVRDSNGQIVTVNGQPKMTSTDVDPRWIGSGWTIFNNKGKAIRQFEPFFTDTHHFEFDVRIGVSPTIFYDAIEQKVATLRPDHTWEKTVFGPWRQETWTTSDTVLVSDPTADLDLGDFFARWPQSDYLPTWYQQRQSGARGPEDQLAAQKAAVHAATPDVAHFDSLGRAFLAIEDNKFKRTDTAATAPPTEEFYQTRTAFDVVGNRTGVTDARNNSLIHYDYDLVGNQLHQLGSDAGDRWLLPDVVGKPIRTWDNRGHQLRVVYDPLRRAVESHLRQGAGPDLMVGRAAFGEATSNPEASNLRTRLAKTFDQAGVVSSNLYDFKGNLLRRTRQLASVYKTTLDWSGTVALETEIYSQQSRYDALNRPIALTVPDGSVVQPSYNEANLLNTISAQLRGGSAVTAFVTNIDYNAKGQRIRVDYGNGARTTYNYDSLTFRLTHLLTQRKPANFPGDNPSPPDAAWPGSEVQNLSYFYDAVGNITTVRDDAQQTIYFRNRRVEPTADYTYDALSRLIEATGREHLGQTSGSPNAPTASEAFDSVHTLLAHPNDGQAMGRYIQRYFYDAVGNILAMRHRGTDPASAGWKRCYQYALDSNRLLSTGRPNDLANPDSLCPTQYSASAVYSEGYLYDPHGNMTQMPHLPSMGWDFRDQLQSTTQQVVTSGGTPETTWYVYDDKGQRIRKVTERQAAANISPSRSSERVYIDGFEVYREYNLDGTTVSLRRETLHIPDEKQRIAIVDTLTIQGGASLSTPSQLVRYQFNNHLSSATLELDDACGVISYEEYYPYGSTSYQAGRTLAEVSLKRYRYTGMECDEESGLSYHTHRYYAPWIGRWTAADPIGVAGGLNLYNYASGHPTTGIDQAGTDTQALQADNSWPPQRDPHSSLTPEEEFRKTVKGVLPHNEKTPSTAKEKSVDVDVVTEQHDKAVVTIVNAAIDAALKQAQESGNEVTVKQILTAALLFFVTHLRNLHFGESSQNIVLRDVDHYFAGRLNEWRNYTKVPFLLSPDRKAAGLAAEAYDDLKRTLYAASPTPDQKDAMSGLEQTDFPTAAPGGRFWSDLGAKKTEANDDLDREFVPDHLSVSVYSEKLHISTDEFEAGRSEWRFLGPTYAITYTIGKETARGETAEFIPEVDDWAALVRGMAISWLQREKDETLVP